MFSVSLAVDGVGERVVYQDVDLRVQEVVLRVVEEHVQQHARRAYKTNISITYLYYY